jgi:hypothetical protein
MTFMAAIGLIPVAFLYKPADSMFEIIQSKPGFLTDTRQHLRPYFFPIMKSENVILPPRTGQHTMGSAGLPFNNPTDV